MQLPRTQTDNWRLQLNPMYQKGTSARAMRPTRFLMQRPTPLRQFRGTQTTILSRESFLTPVRKLSLQQLIAVWCCCSVGICRRSKMKNLVAAGCLFIMMTSSAMPNAQVGNNPPIPPSWTQRPGASPTPTVRNNQSVEDPADRMQRQQLSKLNETRQEQAKADAAKLLALATELKQEADSINSSTLSAKTAKDADEIIKLAKSIKSKIRPL